MSDSKGFLLDKRKVSSVFVITLFLLSMIAVAIPVQADRSIYETIYIRPDGSVDPSTAPIERDGDVYTFTDNIYGSIVIEIDNIIVDGNGYTLQGTGSGTGIYLCYRTNVTIRNMGIKAFDHGIDLYYSSGNRIYGNNITNGVTGDHIGVYIYRSSNNSISGNNIIDNYYGICLFYSNSNIISGNTVLAKPAPERVAGNGIPLFYSNGNILSGNNVSGNPDYGIYMAGSSDNTIFTNTVSNNRGGIYLHSIKAPDYYIRCSNNRIFHNNFINNTVQVSCTDSVNIWDDGYPSGGNYWSGYTGVDYYSGANQDLPGSDGIGDTPYVIDANNVDHYPLMKPLSHVESWSFDTDFQYNLDDNYDTAEGFGHIRGTVTLTGSDLLIQGEVSLSGPIPSHVPTVYLIATDGLDRGYARQIVDLSWFTYSQTAPNTYTFQGKIQNAIKPVNNGHYEVEAQITYNGQQYEFFINTNSRINNHYLPLAQLPSLVENRLPIPVFRIVGKPAIGVEVIFDAEKSYDPDGEIVSYLWDFGDGSQELTYSSEATHTYSEAGRFTVTLTVTDDKGSMNSTQLNILVKQHWAFAIITDIHIGYSHLFLDYGKEGYENDLDGQEYWLTIRLRNVINKIKAINNDEERDYYISFVVVLGDIVDTAEESEFFKAREILDELNEDGIPYIPIFGNHEAWPYTQLCVTGSTLDADLRVYDSQAPNPIGDQYFEKYFFQEGENKNLELIKTLFGDSWEKMPNPEGSEHRLQNYRFSYGGIKFICLDFVSREHVIMPKVGGVKSEAVLHPETLQWLDESLVKESNLFPEPTIIFSHHPIWYNIIQAFSWGEYQTICNLINSHPGSKVIANFAGHVHKNAVDSAFWPWGWVITTEAVYQSTNDIIRIVKVVDANRGIIDYTTLESVEQEPSLFEESAGSTVAVLLSPGELRVYDTQKRVIGWINGTPINQIPNATIYQDLIVLPNSQGPYRYEVEGIDNGYYSLVIANLTQAGDSIATFISSEIPINPNVIHQYTVDWSALYLGEEGVTVQVDSEGDGVFEHTFTSDSELTQSEYIIAIDDIPPKTSILVGEPKFVIGDITYLTPTTPISLIAEDNVGGSGVALTSYRIYNASYDSGWINYTQPFYLTGLTDGAYTIEYNSTDYAGNVEPTNTINVTLFSWSYIFTDSYGRDTILKINTAHKFFQLITPDKDYGIREATHMQQRGRTIIIRHYDDELRLITVAVDTKLDFCIAIAWDKQTHRQYFLIDKFGKE